jgi:hypothetical protein
MTDRYTGYVDTVYELYSLGIRAMPLARIPYAFPNLINHLAFLALRANIFLIYIYIYNIGAPMDTPTVLLLCRAHPALCLDGSN